MSDMTEYNNYLIQIDTVATHGAMKTCTCGRYTTANMDIQGYYI